MERLTGGRLFGLTVLVVLLADQLSKWLVRQHMELNVPLPGRDTLLGRFFSLTRVNNTGMAFGMFRGRSDVLVVVVIVVILALLVYRQRVPPGNRWLQVALGLQVGGATGNLIDRLRVGHVTDFLDFKVWPVFNFSDLSVFCGVVMLAWHLWQEERQIRLSESSEPAASEQGAEADGPAKASDRASQALSTSKEPGD